jgi:hypothetical protein
MKSSSEKKTLLKSSGSERKKEIGKVSSQMEANRSAKFNKLNPLKVNWENYEFRRQQSNAKISRIDCIQIKAEQTVLFERKLELK